MTSSLIGGVPVTISQQTTLPSLIGGVPVTISQQLAMRSRTAEGGWTPRRKRRRVGSSWVDIVRQAAQLGPRTPSAIGGVPVTITEARPLEGSTDPHTGQPVVYYESLYQPGDQVWQALNRASSPCVVSFPAGDFLVSDFASRTQANVATGGGINLEQEVIYGLLGMGPTLTRFVLVEGSSTEGSTFRTPSQVEGGTTQVFIVRSVDHDGALVLRNFGVVGTPQGHNFHGILIENVGGDVLVENVHVSGWCGDNGAPPGETSGLAVKVNSSAQLTIRRVVCDGRYPSGTVAGTVGIHVMHALNPLIVDCSTVNHRVSAAMVAYHTVGAHFLRCRMGSDSSIAGSGWPFNAECNTGAVLEECIFGTTATKLIHCTWSNTTHSKTFSGTPYSFAAGSLLVKGGVWPASGIGGAGGMLAIQSWTSGIDGSDTDTQTTPPQVVNAAGQGQTFRWIHPDHLNITSDDLP